MMAQSPTHRLGQFVGDLIESAVLEFIKSHLHEEENIYVDSKGFRAARGTGLKCTWQDIKGNKHDLDIVIERGGTQIKRGEPIAFIETAWRRYTKHSRNKVQEIQGAIIPLVEKYDYLHPFKGAVIAGAFTKGSITQLESHGFEVLYIPESKVISAFNVVNVNIDCPEKTPDEVASKIVTQLEALTKEQLAEVKTHLRASVENQLKHFVDQLDATLSRQILRIIVIALTGNKQEFEAIEDAVQFVETYQCALATTDAERYEVEILFNNGNRVEGCFKDRAQAIEFILKFK